MTILSANQSFTKLANEYKNIDPLRRVLALMRRSGVKSIFKEHIETKKVQEMYPEEIEDLEKQLEMKVKPKMERLSFFRAGKDELEEILSSGSFRGNFLNTNNVFMGYVNIRTDFPETDMEKTFICEAVIEPPHADPEYPLTRNPYQPAGGCYLTIFKTFKQKVDGVYFSCEGNYFCTQNGHTTFCAHSTIKMILENFVGAPSMGTINRKLMEHGIGIDKIITQGGLSISDITRILESFGYHITSYTVAQIPDRYKNVFRKPDVFLEYTTYAGIESGFPTMVGFSYPSGTEKEEHHLMPVVGHTLERDAWLPDVYDGYFAPRSETEYAGYLANYSWVDNFIIMDDVYGPYYWLPNRVLQESIYSVSVLLPSQIARFGAPSFGPQDIEAIGFHWLYDLINKLKALKDNDISKDFWFEVFDNYMAKNHLVLRTVFTVNHKYLASIKKIYDNLKQELSRQIPEHKSLIEAMESLPEYLWVVEISIPHIITTNTDRIGEIVFAGSYEQEDNPLVLRLPGIFATFPKEAEVSSSASYPIISFADDSPRCPLLRLDDRHVYF